MNGFGATERALARSLSAFPRVKAQLKHAWASANYLLHREPGMREALAPGVRMALRLGGRSEDDARFVGYYEPTPFDADGRRLAHHRLRQGRGEVEVLIHEADGSDSAVGVTKAWSSQQGARLHWVREGGARDRESIVYNDLDAGRLGSRWVSSRRGRWFLPWPVAAMAPRGDRFASLDFVALRAVAPDYGYAEVPAGAGADQGEDAGVRMVEVASGEASLRLSLARARACDPDPTMAGARHELNHVQFAPDGRRVVVIHRWQGATGRFSRLLELDLERDELSVPLAGPMVSHCTFLADGTLVAWARLGDREGYFRRAPAGEAIPLLDGRADEAGDGHPSAAPGRALLVTDSYPDRARQQHLRLLDLDAGKTVPVARFLAPLRFSGGARVDLHPRFAPSGTSLCVDSAHTGVRGCYVLDVRELVDELAGARS